LFQHWHIWHYLWLFENTSTLWHFFVV
jgi:hypothetical protein